MIAVTQQKTLYGAEAQVDQGDRFPSRKAAQHWIHTLMVDTEWWEESYGAVTFIQVGDKKIDRTAAGVSDGIEDGVGYIELQQHPLAQTIIHEVAHLASQARYGVRGHGPEFARVYLELTYRLRGYEVWNALRQEFKIAGVVYDFEEED